MGERQRFERTPDTGKESKEEFRKTARIFLLRSKSSRDLFKELAQGVSPDEINFVTVKFIEKDATSQENKGQIMPVGGNLQPGETWEEAVKRELLEETHLRLARRKKDPHIKRVGDMNYKFQHKRLGKTISNESAFFVGRILPSDVAYPLDPSEDKIAGFHDLNLDELRSLIEYGEHGQSIIDPSKKTILLGSLQKGDTVEQKDDQEVAVIMDGLTEVMMMRELEKSKNVFEHLLRMAVESGELNVEGAQTWYVQLKNVGKDLNKMKVLWKDFWQFCHIGVGSEGKEAFLRKALDMSNFEEEVVNYDGQPKIEADLNLIYALLETGFYSDQYLNIAKRNRNLKDVVGRIEKFAKLLRTGKEGSLHERFKELAVGDNQEKLEKMEVMFLRAFGLEKVEAVRILNIVDAFLSEIHTHSTKKSSKIMGGEKTLMGPASEAGVEEKLEYQFADQLDGVKGSDVGSLLQMAFPSGKEADWKKQAPADPQKRQDYLRLATFEARRKLILMYVFKNFHRYYQQVAEFASDTKMENVIYNRGFRTEPNKYLTAKYSYDQQGDLVDADVYMTDEPTEESEAHPSIAELAKIYYGQIIRAPMKSEKSVMRKSVGHGVDEPSSISDYYRRTIVLEKGKDEESEKRLYERTSKPFKYPDRITSHGFVADENVNEVQAVRDIMDAILDQHPGAKITEYKPTPGIGQDFNKNKRGVSSGKLRLAKFYVEFVERNRAHKEEVQIYTPTRNGDKKKSAFAYLEEKRIDDQKYWVRRLFEPSGMRMSLVEALYRAGIYGKAVRQMFQGYHDEHVKPKRTVTSPPVSIE